MAARQHGVVGLDQAAKLGLSRASISRRVRKGVLERVFPRVYLVVGAPPSLEQRAMAAVLWAGNGAVISHATAAALWDLRRRTGRVIHVTCARNLTSPPSGIVTHASVLQRADRGMLGRIPVTSVTRTLLDIAAHVAPDELLTIVERSILRSLVTPDRLVRACRTDHGRAGVGRLARALDAGSRDGRWASALEREVEKLLDASALPPHEREHPVGSFRLDFAWPEQRVAVEADGRLWHSTRADFARDRRKHNDLLDRGWRVFRVTWGDVHDQPGEVVCRLERLLLGADRLP